MSKVNNALLSEKVDRKLVLSLTLMWIFRKRAFSVSKDFGEFLVEEKECTVRDAITAFLKGNLKEQ